MRGGKHCYPNSDVLVNKYDIHDKKLLEKLEVQKTTIKLLGLDVRPERIHATLDIAHLKAIHEYLFSDVYEWAGEFRSENLYKSERVLSGGTAAYADYTQIENELKQLFERFDDIQWEQRDTLVTEFLLGLWSIHPFREGNTRTCVTFLWHYLRTIGIEFHVELLRNNPLYVRDALVMANYGQAKYLERIIADALKSVDGDRTYRSRDETQENYQIEKEDYEAFKRRYSVKGE